MASNHSLLSRSLPITKQLLARDGYLTAKAYASKPISWAKYNAGKGGLYPLVLLKQSDFDSGTLVALKPAYFLLMEDVDFEPKSNPGFFANTAAKGPLHLGWFAAIAIAGKDIVLDLNGYQLKQSPRHALLQRFFAVVETANSPFVPDQGPGFFTSKIRSCRMCVIKNGRLGFSAHHGIHGNRN